MAALTISTLGKADAPAIGGLTGAPAHVKAAAELIARAGGLTKVGRVFGASAYDPGGHPLGLAVDFTCTPEQGDALAAYAIAHRDELAVKYLIWKQRMAGPTNWGWKAMASRGSATANHMDHVHITFKATGASAGLLDQAKAALGVAAGALTGGASDALSNLNPFTSWKSDAFGLVLKGAFISGGITLVIVGTMRLVVPATLSSAGKLMEAAT